MFRAITSTWLAFLLLFVGGSAYAGKPQIAVLGLEVVDNTGTPTQADIGVAKQLTDGLRGRAKLPGNFGLAPNSDKELLDEKLLENCPDEGEKCMAQIGKDLGADFLMYGKLTKKGGAYVVSMNVLDVHAARRTKTSSDPIPLSQAQNQVELLEQASKIYAKLTGQSTGGTLVVKLTNAERGTILIDGQEKGNITNGVGQVPNLPDGKVKVTIESEGFRRYDETVTIKGGQVDKTVTLEKVAGPVTPPPGMGPGAGPGPNIGPEIGPDSGPKPVVTTRGSALWKGVFVGSVVAGLAGGGVWLYGKNQIDDASNGLRNGCAYPDSPASCTPIGQGDVDSLNSKGDSGRTKTIVGGVIVGVSGALAVVAFYEGFIAQHDGPGSKEHAANGRRVRRERFVVTPVIAPNGGGATLQFDW